MNSQDFERYAKIKAMIGQISQTWIDAFMQDIRPELLPSACVLDYGFGDGRFYEFYLQYFEPYNIHGVEPSEIRTQKAWNRGWTHATHLPLHQPLPYSNCSFDFVNMVEVIEHIPRGEVAFYLSEIRRVLKPGGKLLLSTPNYPIKRAYDVVDALFLRQLGRLKDDPTHVSRYTTGCLRKVLGQHFSRITMKPYKFGRLYRFTRHRLVWHKILAVCA